LIKISLILELKPFLYLDSAKLTEKHTIERKMTNKKD